MPNPKNESTKQTAFISLLRAHDRLHGEFADLFKRNGLTEPQYNVLRILRGAGDDGLPCSQITERMITRTPDVTRLLDRLESNGLVQRQRVETDRRVVLVRLTPAGSRLLSQLDEPVQKLHEQQFARLNDRELQDLIRLLDKVVKNHRLDAHDRI
jgi:DNA-binding MarR family transcriptional regulator